MILKVYYEEKKYVLFEGNIIRKLNEIPNESSINYIIKTSNSGARDIFYIENYGKTVTTVVTNELYEILNNDGLIIID